MTERIVESVTFNYCDEGNQVSSKTYLITKTVKTIGRKIQQQVQNEFNKITVKWSFSKLGSGNPGSLEAYQGLIT